MSASNIELLICRYLDGIATEAEVEELNALLAGNPAVRRDLILAAAQDAQVAGLVRGDSEVRNAVEGSAVRAPVGPAPVVSQRTDPESFSRRYLRESSQANWGLRLVAALAASLAIVAGGYWFLNHDRISRQCIALVQAVDGQVEIARDAQRIPVEVGALVLDQDTITVAPGASADIHYTREATAVTLLSATTAKFTSNRQAMQIWLNVGRLGCEVAHQPVGRPMQFITPQAVADVLGTKLNLAVSSAATRLDVTEGSVKLTRNDGASVTVKTGDFAVAAAGVELKAESVIRAPVVIKPGQNIQAALSANTTGTTFIVKAGLYREQSVTPKDWDVFIGEPGTIMNGVHLLTNFVQQGSMWMATASVPEGQIHGIGAVDPGWEGSVYPSDLFFNDVALHHVLTQKEVVPGRWYIDYGKGNIYVADNPAGKKVGDQRDSLRILRPGKQRHGSRVHRRKNMQFHTSLGRLGISIRARTGLFGTTESGSTTDAASQARMGRAHREQYASQRTSGHWKRGAGAGRSSCGVLVEGKNELAFNNTLHFNPDWIGGGAKFGTVNGLICRNNNVHDNYGFG